MKIKGITNIEYFTKGHRGILYTGEYKKKKIVIKAKLPKSEALNRIENEGNWLKRLNKINIGPKLIKAEKDYFFYEYVEGEFILDYFKDKNKKTILNIIKEVLSQCYELDKLKVDKEEMHHPLKHILIKKDKVTMLDFERCHIVDYGKNTTQFVVFLMKLSEFLSEYDIIINKEKLIALSKLYKHKQTKENFENIIKELN
jgi:putative serine/threonine protein kinase|tara:strand:+ start:70 stop:669 length:600 start_codon:yes stop_codon:yes gene_type:complete